MANDWWRTDVNVKEGPEEYARRVGTIRSRMAGREKKDRDRPETVMPRQPAADQVKDVAPGVRPTPTAQVVQQPPSPISREIAEARERPIVAPEIYEPPALLEVKPDEDRLSEWVKRIAGDYWGNIMARIEGAAPEQPTPQYGETLEQAIARTQEAQPEYEAQRGYGEELRQATAELKARQEAGGAVRVKDVTDILGKLYLPTAKGVGQAVTGLGDIVGQTAGGAAVLEARRVALERGLVEAGPGVVDPRGMTIEQLQPSARFLTSYAFGPELEALRAPSDEEAGLGDLYDRWREAVGDDERTATLVQDMEAVRRGADPVETARQRYNVGAELIGGAALDPLIGLEALEMLGIGSRLSHRGRLLSAAQKNALSAIPTKEASKLTEYATALAAQRSGDIADATEALSKTMPDVTPIKRKPLERSFGLTNQSQMQRMQASAAEALANVSMVADDAQDMQKLLDGIRDTPGAMVGRLGDQIVGPSGQALSDVLKIMGDDVKKLPSLQTGTWNPAKLPSDFILNSEEAMKTAYNVSDEMSRNLAVRFANWQRGLISELWLNAKLRPGYAVQNMLSDTANIIFDGVNPFKKRGYLEDFEKTYGYVSPRIKEGLARPYEAIYNIKPETSNLPGFVPEKARQFSKSGVNLAQKWEHGRVARTYADQFETALSYLSEQNVPGLSDELLQSLSPAKQAELQGAVVAGKNKADKMERALQVVNAPNPATAAPYRSYLSRPEMVRSLPDDFDVELGRRFAELGVTTPEQAQRVLGEYVAEIHQAHNVDLAALGDIRPTALNTASTEVDDALAALDDLSALVLEEPTPGLQAVLNARTMESAQLTQALNNSHRALSDSARQVNSVDGRDLVSYIYQQVNENRRLMREDIDRANYTLTQAMEGKNKATRAALRAEYQSETVFEIMRSFSQERLNLYNQGTTQLQQIAGGMPFEQVIGVSRLQVANDDMLRMSRVPPRDLGYQAQRVSVENWNAWNAFEQAERAYVDQAMNETWNQFAQVDPAHTPEALDTIFSTITDNGVISRQTRGEVQPLFEEADRLGDSAVWQKAREEAQDLYMKGRDKQVARWNQATQDIASGNFSPGPQNSAPETVRAAQQAAQQAPAGANPIAQNSARTGALGDAPLAPQVKMADEAVAKRAMAEIEQGIMAHWDEWSPTLQPQASATAVRKWFRDEVVPSHLDDMAVAQDYANRVTNETMLDYGSRTGFDMALNLMFPFTFWYTRTGRNWARRLMRRPAILGNFLRTKEALKEVNDAAGRRRRFETKIGVRLPQPIRERYPEAGEYVHFDPLSAFLPFASVARWNWDEPEEGATGLRSIMNLTKQYGFRTFPAYDIVYESGMLRGIAEGVGVSPEQAEMLGPALEGNVGFQLPMTGPIQGITAAARPALQGTPLEQFVPAEGVNIEAFPRQMIGLPRGEFYQPYRVSRMVGNLMEADPTDTELARTGLMAAEMADRWEEAKQVGRPWETGDAMALDYQEEYGLTDQELAEAQDVLQEAVKRAAMERLLPQTTSVLTGMPVSVEPSGEAMQIGMQREAETLGFPRDPEGSREALMEFRRAMPGQYVRQAAYGALPGEEPLGFTPTERGNWLKQKEGKEEIFARYQEAIDAHLRQNPWDSKGKKAIDVERKAEIGQVKERYPLPEITDDIPPVMWGMNEAEAWDALVESWGYDQEEPVRADFGEDYDVYDAAREKWLSDLPETFPFGETPTAGDYEGMDPNQAYRYFRQANDSPLEAALWTYKDRISGPAWDAYFASGRDWEPTIGRVRAVPATMLIPAIIQDYQGRWSEQELREELKGVTFPALKDQD